MAWKRKPIARRRSIKGEKIWATFPTKITPDQPYPRIATEQYNLVTEKPAIAEYYLDNENDLPSTKVLPFENGDFKFLCPICDSVYTESLRKKQSPVCVECRIPHAISNIDIFIYQELAYIFGVNNTGLSNYIEGRQIDVTVKLKNANLKNDILLIEYDGGYMHAGEKKAHNDAKKAQLFDENGYTLIRFRSPSLEKCRDNDIFSIDKEISVQHAWKNNYEINTLLIFIRDRIDLSQPIMDKLNSYITNNKVMGNKLGMEAIKNFKISEQISLAGKANNRVLKIFDKARNAPLTPEHFTFSTSRYVWWNCAVEEHPPFYMSIGAITAKQNDNNPACPFCGGQRFIPKDSLGGHYPDLVPLFDEEKNQQIQEHNIKNNKSHLIYATPNLDDGSYESLTAFNIGKAGKKEFHWKCCKHNYSWKECTSNLTARFNRYGVGCPKCKNDLAHADKNSKIRKMITPDYNAAVIYPELVDYFSKELNGCTFNSISPASNTKFFFICPKCGKNCNESGERLLIKTLASRQEPCLICAGRNIKM